MLFLMQVDILPKNTQQEKTEYLKNLEEGKRIKPTTFIVQAEILSLQINPGRNKSKRVRFFEQEDS